jgi:hypothetical protein
MNISNYYSENADGIQFSRQQASDFAKQVADDFNPIHDPDSKRFCVPGDLLFAVVLSRYGLSEKMHFNFSGLVSDGVPLLFPESDANKIAISDRQGKEYLNFERSGAVSNATSLISDLTQSYVAFSGHNFEHVLVPLMRDNDVMINPDRPLVIYESMSVDLERFDVTSPQLILEKSTLDVDGRRGKIRMQFRLTSDQGDFGHGEKSMILSGLRPADPAALQGMLDDYIGFKATYTRPDQVP